MAKRNRPFVSSNSSRKKRKLDLDIIHPEIGQRLYRSLKLENGLDVILVSDSSIYLEDGSLSAAAMAVRIGSFDDPEEYPGLAHLLEHTIQSGSKKFPELDAYSGFLSEHGGYYNGCTHMEHSVFHFAVDPAFLGAALDRFADIFISPLLEINTIERDIQMVDSEFYLNLSNDDVRSSQLMGHTSAHNHPFNRFANGNIKSLVKESLGLNHLHKQIKKLFNDNYRGGSMALSVVGRESLDLLEYWVRTFFSPIKKGSKRYPEAHYHLFPIWNPNVVYMLEAIGDVHKFSVSWMIPGIPPDFHIRKPEVYFVEVLGHEGKGSLYSYFKNKGWVNSLFVSAGGSARDCTSVGRAFTIAMDLTLLGLTKKYEIVSGIYQYISFLRRTEPQQWVMDEYFRIKKIEFDSLNFDGPYTGSLMFSQYIAGNMLDYPTKHVISGEYLAVPWNPEAIKDTKTYSHAYCFHNDLFLLSLSSEFKIEPWYHSRYFEEEIPLFFKEEWNKTSQVHASLRLPSRNRFIPSHVSIRDHSDEDLSPIILVDNPYMKIWCKCDGGFSYTYFHIYLNIGSDNVKNHIMAQLFIGLLKDELNEIIFLGTATGLSTELSLCHDNKVVLKVHGYRDKLSLYLSEIWALFISFRPKRNRFEIIKESLEREIKNKNTDIVVQSEQLLLEVFFYRYKKKSTILKSIEYPELLTFIAEFRSQIFVEGICFGDLLESEAKKISNVFQRRIPTPLHKRNSTGISVSLLTRPKHIKNFSVKLSSETDSLAKVYYQIPCEVGHEPRDIAMLDLFTSVVEDNLFHQLRTIGYYVVCKSLFICGVGYEVCVRSSNYNPSHISKRIYNAISNLGTLLENLSDESFESFKKGVIAKLPNDSGMSIWKQIVCKSYILDFYMKEKDEISKIKKKDLIRWYKKNFRGSSCRSVAICVWGCKKERARVLKGLMISNMRKKMQKMRKMVFVRKVRFLRF